jgi:hypothetical protein
MTPTSPADWRDSWAVNELAEQEKWTDCAIELKKGCSEEPKVQQEIVLITLLRRKFS